MASIFSLFSCCVFLLDGRYGHWNNYTIYLPFVLPLLIFFVQSLSLTKSHTPDCFSIYLVLE